MSHEEQQRGIEGARLAGALWGMLVGDAFAAPAHWFYNPETLRSVFPPDGSPKEYVAPADTHADSMVLGMTYEGKPDILLDSAKELFRGSTGSGHKDEHGNDVGAPPEERPHYHRGLAAGENTANAKLARLAIQHFARGTRFDPRAHMAELEAFMEAKKHNDTYLDLFLREYFTRRGNGLEAEHAGKNQRDMWSIGSMGGLVVSLPASLANVYAGEAAAVARGIELAFMTHKSANVAEGLALLVPVLVALITRPDAAHGDDMAQCEAILDGALARARRPAIRGDELRRKYKESKGPGKIPKDEMWRIHTKRSRNSFLDELNEQQLWQAADYDVVGNLLTEACYPEGGVLGALFFARKFSRDPMGAFEASTSCGGDSTSRGSILGSILGAMHGRDGLPEPLVTGLKDAADVRADIGTFVDLVIRDADLW